MYTATIKAVLEEDFDDNDERNMLLSTVLMCERDIYTKNFLRGPDGEEQASLIERLAELRRYEFAARYGDYMSHVCQKLKTTAKVYKTEYYESLHGWDRYWTDINHSINIEQTNWTRRTLRDPTVTDDDVKTTLTIYNACEHMAIDFDKILQVIAMYTDRNSLVHASILRYVKRGNWHLVSSTLARDLRELPSITPSNIAHTIPLMQEIIRTVVDEYFDAHGDYDNFYRWLVKESSIEITTDMNNTQARHDVMTREHEKLQKVAEKRVQEIITNHSMIHLTSAITSLSPPTSHVSTRLLKRPLSPTEKEARVGTYKRQKKAWNALVSLQRRTCDNLTKYKLDYGSTEPPMCPETWFLLAEDKCADDVGAAPQR